MQKHKLDIDRMRQHHCIVLWWDKFDLNTTREEWKSLSPFRYIFSLVVDWLLQCEDGEQDRHNVSNDGLSEHQQLHLQLQLCLNAGQSRPDILHRGIFNWAKIFHQCSWSCEHAKQPVSRSPWLDYEGEGAWLTEVAELSVHHCHNRLATRIISQLFLLKSVHFTFLSVTQGSPFCLQVQGSGARLGQRRASRGGQPFLISLFALFLCLLCGLQEEVNHFSLFAFPILFICCSLKQLAFLPGNFFEHYSCTFDFLILIFWFEEPLIHGQDLHTLDYSAQVLCLGGRVEETVPGRWLDHGEASQGLAWQGNYPPGLIKKLIQGSKNLFHLCFSEVFLHGAWRDSVHRYEKAQNYQIIQPVAKRKTSTHNDDDELMTLLILTINLSLLNREAQGSGLPSLRARRLWRGFQDDHGLCSCPGQAYQEGQNS